MIRSIPAYCAHFSGRVGCEDAKPQWRVEVLWLFL